MILVDTSVWVRSLRPDGAQERHVLDQLLNSDEVATTDLVVAEVLQGCHSEQEYETLTAKLDGPHFFHAHQSIWLRAARLSFELARVGQTTPLSDLVIATVAMENDLELYTRDADFQRVNGLRLYEAPTT
jgi:predicted nucleic acid-binding protein